MFRETSTSRIASSRESSLRHPLLAPGQICWLCRWRLCWQRHTGISQPALSTRDRRGELGFTFGASAIDFVGTVSNIRRASDVNGVYAAAGAGAAVGTGAGAIVLTNQNGAVLTLSGRQAGLIVAADLNGLAISLR